MAFHAFLGNFAGKENNMKKKVKQNIWIIAILVITAAGINIILPRQASKINFNSSNRNEEYLTGYHAEFWKNRKDGYIQALHKLADVMGSYEAIQAEERRDRYDELLKSTMEAEPQLVLLYTVWKPNALDGMDELYIGRIGSSMTGQYAMTYNKETGIMVKRCADIDSPMAYITGPDARKDRIENPVLQKINGADKYTIRMMVPIINNNNGEVVGALGCLLVIDVIQQVLENTLKTNKDLALGEIHTITKFIIIPAAIAALTITAVIFAVHEFVTKPTITVTDTLKNDPKEHINITLNRISGINEENREYTGHLVRKARLLKAA